MGKYNAASDLDYYDCPQAAGTPCATPGCEQTVSAPEWDTYCLACRQQQQDRAETHERWLANLERKQKGAA